MAFRFTWTCRPVQGSFDLYCPGATKIEYEIVGQKKGYVDSDTLIIPDAGEIWVRMSRGADSTKWVQLRPGFGDSMITAARAVMELGV